VTGFRAPQALQAYLQLLAQELPTWYPVQGFQAAHGQVTLRPEDLFPYKKGNPLPTDNTVAKQLQDDIIAELTQPITLLWSTPPGVIESWLRHSSRHGETAL